MKTLFGIEKLQHKRASCNNAGTTRQKVPATVNQRVRSIVQSESNHLKEVISCLKKTK